MSTSSMRCPQCNLLNWCNAEACKRCRFPISQAAYAAAPGGSVPSDPFAAPDPFAPPTPAAGAGPAISNGNHGGYGPSGFGQPDLAIAFPFALDLPPRSGGAVASLILGISSVPLMMLCGLGLFTGIAGLITGIVALRRAKRLPHMFGGHGMAVGGVATSGVAMAMSLLIFAIAIPNFIATRRAANEASAQSSLRTISAGELTFQATSGHGRFGTLEDLSRARLIDQRLASGSMNGYHFGVIVSDSDFAATAVPETYGSSGVRSFFISSDGLIRAVNRHGSEANLSDPSLVPGTDRTDDPSQSAPAYRRPSEASAVASVRALQTALVTYQATAGNGKFGTLKQLADQHLVSDELGRGVKDGYLFKIRVTDTQYEIIGTPKPEYPMVGDDLRSFYMGSDGVIHAARKHGADATASDPIPDSL